MIQEIKGDLLETDCQVIAHGVNCQGVMGSGVAKALYEKWPEIKNEYLTFYDDWLPNKKRSLEETPFYGIQD